MDPCKTSTILSSLPRQTAAAANVHAIAPERPSLSCSLVSRLLPPSSRRPQKSSPFPLPQRVTNYLCGKEMHSVVGESHLMDIIVDIRGFRQNKDVCVTLSTVHRERMLA